MTCCFGSRQAIQTKEINKERERDLRRTNETIEFLTRARKENEKEEEERKHLKIRKK